MPLAEKLNNQGNGQRIACLNYEAVKTSYLSDKWEHLCNR